MRLVLATPLYPPEPGGPATYAKLLGEKLPVRGTVVEIVKFSDVSFYPKLVRHFAYFWRVFRAALGADAVYALDPVSTGLPACLAAMLARKPLYVRIAGDYAWEQGTQRFGVTDMLDEFVTKDSYGMAVKLLKNVQTYVARKAKRVVVPSDYLKRMVAAWGIPEENIVVVYNAAPKFGEGAELPRPKDAPSSYIVTLCRLVPWKGVAALIRVLEELRAKGENVSLVVIGSGPEEQRLKRMAVHLKLKEYVVFTGALPSAAAHAYVKHADAFILNTRYEGFSHVLLEAFALGTSVITTNVGGNAELVEHEKTGLIVPFDDVTALTDAVTRVRSDAALRDRLTTNARVKVGEFSRDRVADETVAALV